MRLLLRPQAEDDLVAIWRYIARDNPAAADRVLDALESALQLLAEQPGLGAALQSERPDLQGIRFHPLRRFRNYVIYYLPLADGIDVVRVLERHRDRRGLLDQDT